MCYHSVRLHISYIRTGRYVCVLPGLLSLRFTFPLPLLRKLPAGNGNEAAKFLARYRTYSSDMCRCQSPSADPVESSKDIVPERGHIRIKTKDVTISRAPLSPKGARKNRSQARKNAMSDGARLLRLLPAVLCISAASASNILTKVRLA